MGHPVCMKQLPLTKKQTNFTTIQTVNKQIERCKNFSPRYFVNNYKIAPITLFWTRNTHNLPIIYDSAI